MIIIFTRHSEKRIEKRGILRQEALEAVRYPDNTEKRHSKHYIRKRLERGTIELCCEKTEKYLKIITIYWV